MVAMLKALKTDLLIFIGLMAFIAALCLGSAFLVWYTFYKEPCGISFPDYVMTFFR